MQQTSASPSPVPEGCVPFCDGELPSGRYLNHAGQTFGLLRAERPAYRHPRLGLYWSCDCACGSKTVVRANNLVTGSVRSCGCLLNRRWNRSPKWKGSGDIPGRMWRYITNNAKARGIPMDVSIEDAAALFSEQGGRCALTCLPLTMPTCRDDIVRCRFTASLDRIDSSLGYSRSNIQWVHKDINRMKNVYPLLHFLQMCRLVAKQFPEDSD